MTHKIRIIAGKHRGRKLPVLQADSLRPTKDIVRETLFNWLQPVIEGARCLDVFAGSGILGFEAVSRGADSVVMLEQDKRLCRNLHEQADKLQLTNAQIHQVDAIEYLRGQSEPFNIVFLDPPFAGELLSTSIELLNKGDYLQRGGLVYLEAAAKTAIPSLPEQWQCRHEKQSGDVRYALYTVI